MLENIIDAPIERDANTPRAVLVEIKELHEFSRLVRTLGTGRWIFRGHADKNWRLESSLERQLVNRGIKSINKIVQNAINSIKYDKYRASDEMYAIDQFKRYASMKLPKLDHLVVDCIIKCVNDICISEVWDFRYNILETATSISTVINRTEY